MMANLRVDGEDCRLGQFLFAERAGMSPSQDKYNMIYNLHDLVYHIFFNSHTQKYKMFLKIQYYINLYTVSFII